MPAPSLARSLRRTETLEEALLWGRLRDRRLEGLKFRRQHVAGPYVLDLYCAAARVAVEVVGSQHGGLADRERDAWLLARGVRTVRVWNHDVRHRMDHVLELILDVCRSGAPQEPV